jgi:dihydroorotase
MTAGERRAGQWDLVLKGGRVLDPGCGLDGPLDVAIAGERVTALGLDLPVGNARQVLDVRGLLVTSGWIDLHTHVYWRGNWSGVDPRRVAPVSGSTTLVDAGSSGAGTFPGFLAYVIEQVPFRILAFLNIAFTGIQGALGRVDFAEAGDPRLLNVWEAVRLARDHPLVIRGIKVRLGRHGSAALGTTALQSAQEAAEILGLPVMAHIDDPPPRITEVLRLLRPGDVLTHAFRAAPNCLLTSSGQVRPEAWDAKERGVVFDVGHGLRMFSLDVARRALAQGFAPDTVSTDIYRVSAVRQDLTQPAILSKLMALGLSLPEAIRAVTTRPAKVLGLEGRLGVMTEGSTADVAVFRQLEGEFEYLGMPESILEAEGRERRADERVVGHVCLEPVHLIARGRLLESDDTRQSMSRGTGKGSRRLS